MSTEALGMPFELDACYETHEYEEPRSIGDCGSPGVVAPAYDPR